MELVLNTALHEFKKYILSNDKEIKKYFRTLIEKYKDYFVPIEEQRKHGLDQKIAKLYKSQYKTKD